MFLHMRIDKSFFSGGWNNQLEQLILSIFNIPGILRHFAFIQINALITKSIKIIIEQICQELMDHDISVVGVTTDNGANLVKCFYKIENDAFINHPKFPIIRFACAAHKSQLIIGGLKK